jgi:hypothetical protein
MFRTNVSSGEGAAAAAARRNRKMPPYQTRPQHCLAVLCLGCQHQSLARWSYRRRSSLEFCHHCHYFNLKTRTEGIGRNGDGCCSHCSHCSAKRWPRRRPCVAAAPQHTHTALAHRESSLVRQDFTCTGFTARTSAARSSSLSAARTHGPVARPPPAYLARSLREACESQQHTRLARDTSRSPPPLVPSITLLACQDCHPKNSR